MPKVLIEVRKKHSQVEEIALMDAVQSAISQAFHKPDDINVALLVHEPHRFAVPVMKSQPDRYTHISIDCIVGRSLATKRNLYRTIVDNLEGLGIPKDHVKILLRENSKENWGIRSGQAACDVELGYEIEV